MPDLAAQVTSTVATKHYGVEADSIWNDELDYGQNKIRSREGKERCSTMTWYIGIGEDLQRDAEIKFSFYRSINADYSSADLIFEEILYESKDKTAPRHRSKGEHVKVNCTLKSDLRDVDRQLFKLETDTDGRL